MNKFISLGLLCFFLVINIILILQNTLIFTIDVARDFFLFKEIVEINHTMLIGARSSVSGLFHGPAWLYLNIPAYLLIKGNPQYIMWYWLLLYILFVGASFVITKKLFDKKSAILVAVLLASQAAFYINKATNPYGAVLIFPIFFYFMIQYFHTFYIKYLLIGLFLIGLLIQFEIAFGLGILIITIPYLVFILQKQKRLMHLTSLFILCIPLSTFILFELKSNFLQTKAALELVINSEHAANFFQTITSRFIYTFVYGWQQFHLAEAYEGYFQFNIRLLNLFVGLIMLFAFYKALQLKNFKYKHEVLFFLVLYFGFWIQTFILSKAIEWYYYWPFVSVITMMFVIIREYIPKNIFLILITFILAINTYSNIQLLHQNTEQTKYWKFQKKIADSVYQKGDSEFGYFLNAFDQISISLPYYAMVNTQREYPAVNAIPFQKKKITYLIHTPYPDGKPLDSKWWKEYKVKLTTKPKGITQFKNGFVIERYELTEDEINIEPDSSIFNSVDFR